MVNLTGEDKVLQVSEPLAESFLSRLPSAASTPANAEARGVTLTDIINEPEKLQTILLPAKNEGFSIPSQVS